MADEIRYPDGGIGEDSVREIRRIKARIEAERMPRGMDPALNLKLGPGGLADVEWVVQLLQLRHAHAVPGLRTTRTLAALQAASGAGLVERRRSAALTAAWQLASPDPGRRHADARPGIGRAAHRRRPSWPSWPGCSATRRTAPSSSPRTGGGPPGTPGP